MKRKRMHSLLIAMRLSLVKNMGLMLLLAVMGLPSRSSAGTIVTVPPSLAPGSQYRLVFVTADTYNATSSNIADYNTDVNNEANSTPALAALGVTWTAIGSTATVDAIDNIGRDPGVPVYDFLGNQIANDATTGAGGLFTGSSLLNPFDTDENGNPHFADRVWTGTGFDGTSLGGLGPLGDPVQTIWGGAGIVISDYLFFSLDSSQQDYRLYGISGVLTTPASPTPEPSTTAMVILAGALTFFARRRVHGNRRATRTLC